MSDVCEGQNTTESLMLNHLERLLEGGWVYPKSYRTIPAPR